jgi:hypothetical protein
VLGEVSCLAVALVSMPALVLVLGRRARVPRAARSTGPVLEETRAPGVAE